MKWLLVAGAAGLAIAAAGLGVTPVRAGTEQPGAVAAASPGSRSPGTFGKAVYLSAPNYPAGVAIAHLTGAGRADLLIDGGAGAHGYLWMYPQLADGRLGTPQKYAHTFMTSYPLTVTDLYRTGTPDVLLLGLHGILVYTPHDGRLAGPTVIQVPVRAFTVADVNHDGHPDILLDNAGRTSVTIYYGTPSHAFRPGPTLRFGGTRDSTVVTAGFGHPGQADDIVYSSTYGARVRQREANGSWGPVTGYTIVPIHGSIYPSDGAAATGDLTGDGRPDLVLTDADDPPRSGIEVYADTPSGHLGKPVIYRTGGIPGAMQIADLTGNGRGDLVIQHVGFNEVGVMLQQSSGRLAPEVLYPVTGCCNFPPGNPAIGDLNGDGRPDIAVSTTTGAAILYQNS